MGPPPTNKLPNNIPAPSYACKTQLGAGPSDDEKAAKEKAPRATGRRPPKKVPAEKEFVDGFKKFVSQQPPMMEAMAMAPGVELTERGQMKKNEQLAAKGMSRKAYENMVQREGATVGGQAPAMDMDLRGDLQSPVGSVRDLQQGVGDELPSVRGAGEGFEPSDSFAQLPGERVARDVGPRLKVVRGPDKHSNLVPHAPATPRPLQGVTPAARRVQLQRDALGFVMSSRERPLKASGASSYGPGRMQLRTGEAVGIAPQDSPREPLASELVAAGAERSDGIVKAGAGTIVSPNPA